MHCEVLPVPRTHCLLHHLHVNYDSGCENKHARLFLHSTIIFFFHTADPKKDHILCICGNDRISMEAVYHINTTLLLQI